MNETRIDCFLTMVFTAAAAIFGTCFVKDVYFPNYTTPAIEDVAIDGHVYSVATEQCYKIRDHVTDKYHSVSYPYFGRLSTQHKYFYFIDGKIVPIDPSANAICDSDGKPIKNQCGKPIGYNPWGVNFK